jgi:hypothetical protein
MIIKAWMISTISILPACIAAIFRFRRNPDFLPFCYLIFFGTAVEIIASISGYFHLNNLWLLNCFVLVQFYLIMYQLYVWRLFKLQSFTAIGAVAIVTILWTAEAFNNSLTRDFSNFSLVFSSFFIALFVTVYINRLIFEKIKVIIADARFIISVGLLLYFTSNFIVFLFIRNDSMSAIFFRNLWTIHDIINIFTNILFAIGLLCIRRK